MGDPVKARSYRSPRRTEQAGQTRRAVLQAARELFAERGYAGTTVAAIAQRAGVAVDTLYASVGPKPVLFRLLLETALSGSDEVVPGEQRDYVARIVAEPTAAGKLGVYAAAVVAINERLAPLLLVLATAADAAPELAAMRDQISERRARNMHLFALDLASTGDVRPGLAPAEVADVVWSMNSAEYHRLLVQERGWPPERFAAWLADSWCRLFLR